MKTKNLIILAALAVVTLLVFWPVIGHDFVNLDDDRYVTANRHVRGGLTGEDIRWAFTSLGYASNWHPLTWLSHMLDAQLFGLKAGPHHAVNLLLHAAATLILFLVLRLATGAVWPSAFTAALFAVHPLHVESVAWVAERKDVLSGLFWMLTMLAYIWYLRKPGAGRYLAMTGCFVLGLLAKPMLVSLPLVLLFFDWWPLNRFTPQGLFAARGRLIPGLGRTPPSADFGLITEKIPLFLLAGGSAAMTYLAQQRGGALALTGYFGTGTRLANAIVSVNRYLGRLIVPKGLAVFYPFAPDLSAGEVAAAALVAAGITLACLLAARRLPMLLTGWLWYLITLIPVIGIVQIGFQSMADRYTYIPYIGLFMMIAWGVGAASRRFPRQSAVLAAGGILVLALLSAAARHQVAFWGGSITLFERAVSVTKDNWLAENNLGTVLQQNGRIDEAITHFTKALAIQPDYGRARVNLGSALLAKGRTLEAIPQYEEALRLDPGFYLAWYNLGIAMTRERRFEAAAADFRKAIDYSPEYADAYGNLGAALFNLGRYDEALETLREALRLDPSSAFSRYNMGLTLYRKGQTDQAATSFREVIRLAPGRVDARYMLGLLAEEGRKPDEALAWYREVLRLSPEYAEARAGLERLSGASILGATGTPAP
jgi:tetratricopeptide (TPR) repeat protein